MSTVSEGMSGMREFLQEGLRMRNFHHDRVMTLTGISFDDNNAPMIITPYMHNGDLQKYIMDAANVRFSSDYGPCECINFRRQHSENFSTLL